MNLFTAEKPDFEFSNSYFFDSQHSSIEESLFMVSAQVTKENDSETNTVEKPQAEAAKQDQTKINAKVKNRVKRKKLTKLEREINKREKDRQRAKRNRDKKKEQFKSLQSQLDEAYDIVKAKEQKIRELESKLARMEQTEVSLF
ncbi:unnamed protein product [Moneuplotes crassus]|uniref:BZIP domain-containing protein n=1 Tax=Euplotes crassus TaxID=5936 RepID=A0AAD1TZ70_EUPCR|nr:unnamed protein product [Moneuplotes crassus]